MDFLIQNAWAQAAGGQQGGGLQLIIFLGLFFLIFYFMLIRPQSKRAKEHRAMVSALAIGDEVVTGGGILGRVTEIGENFVTLEVADNVRIKVQKVQVTALMPKGTLKGG